MPRGISKHNYLGKYISISRTAATFTAFDNAKISTAQSQFGGASALFDGTNDYISTPESASWDVGTNTNFTIECWYRAISQGSIWRGIISHQKPNLSAADAGWAIYHTSGGNISFLVAGATVTSSTTVGNNVWTHIAVVKNGSTIKVYLNGVERASSTPASINTNGTDPLVIGYGRDIGGGQFRLPQYINGYVDEVRISKIARYTAGFSVPTSAFTNDADTLLLLHMDGANNSTTFTDDNS